MKSFFIARDLGDSEIIFEFKHAETSPLYGSLQFKKIKDSRVYCDFLLYDNDGIEFDRDEDITLTPERPFLYHLDFLHSVFIKLASFDIQDQKVQFEIAPSNILKVYRGEIQEALYKMPTSLKHVPAVIWEDRVL